MHQSVLVAAGGGRGRGETGKLEERDGRAISNVCPVIFVTPYDMYARASNSV